MRHTVKWLGQIWGVLLLSALVLSAPAFGQERASLPKHVSLGVGLVSAAQMDRGYSPLVFSGVQGSVEATYSQVKEG